MNELMAVMILSVMTAIFCNCVEKPEKFGTSLRPFTRTCRFNAFSMKTMKEFYGNTQSIEGKTFGSDLMRPNYEGGLFHIQSCFLKAFKLERYHVYKTSDILRDKRFSCDFLRFVSIAFTLFIFNVVSRTASEDQHSSVLICRPETSVLVNEVTVLSRSINRVPICHTAGSIFGALWSKKKEDQKLYYNIFCLNV